FDDADIRRGKPSVHKAFSEPLALLTGDTLIIQAFDVMAEAAEAHPDRGVKLLRLLSKASGSPHGICAGQAWESERQVDLDAYHRAKTGALFIAASAMGAAAAGHDPDQWGDLGARIGEAFQIADDLSDALKTEEELGKPVGQDAVHDRPNAVAERGVEGAIKHLEDALAGAIASIPSCPGEAALCQMVRYTAEKLTPILPTPAKV
ncbi:MAG: polyprenyl synthetase family protein, partial [Pseudomonadota bacterium]